MLPETLPGAIHSALNIRPWPGAEDILAQVFPPVANPAEYAAEIIADELAKTPHPGSFSALNTQHGPSTKTGRHSGFIA